MNVSDSDGTSHKKLDMDFTCYTVSTNVSNKTSGRNNKGTSYRSSI